MKNPIFISLFSFILFSTTPSFSETVQYDITIGYKQMNFTGKTVTAMTLNDTIPGPTLKFKEGDFAIVNIHNSMDVETSVHWHGILLPNRQDGVPYVNNPPIEPSQTVKFQFPIKQTGTFWYHSHTGLQEQRGVYGGIVISPKEGETIQTAQDKVTILSDWIDENPDEVMRTLKSGNEYYNWKKGTIQSFSGAISKKAVSDFSKRSLMRMPPMDLSDVAYDRFLANGKPEISILAKPGEKIRFRFINAGASTYFYLQFAGSPLQVVAADGINIQPIKINRLLIAIAETYDIIVTVPASGAYELRANSQDGSGKTSIFIGNGKKVYTQDVPKPNLYKMKMPKNSSNKKMMRNLYRPLSPYKILRATNPTSLPSKNPSREIVLNLTGDMNRFVWSINGKTISAKNKINIRHGENIRFIIKNKTMMHHPMHLHGHFFRLVNGQENYSPLKHTVDVPPNGTQIIEFEASEFNDWFFHCHVLYHAKAGMARVISYEDNELDNDLKTIRPKLYKDSWFAWGNGTIQSHMTDGSAVLSNSYNILSAVWEIGWNRVDQIQSDIELTYDRYFNRFFTVFVGGNLTDEYERGIFGFRYLLPFNFASTLGSDTKGEFRITLEQSVRLASRLEAFGDFEYDTESKEEWVVGANYLMSKNLLLVSQYHSDFGPGAGIRVWF
jgi:FtsP/CotA-like multicopper oxidase with cupredoxin domain